MASQDDMAKADATYNGFVKGLTVSLIITAIVTAIVVLLIASGSGGAA